ncbi:MAG: hypothetical protein PVI30_15850 [Myxococcales bacterium]
MAGPALAATGCAAALVVVRPQVFDRFLGGVHPLLALPACGLAALLLARPLDARGFGPARSRETVRGLARAALVAAALGAVVIAEDLLVGFPRDINEPLPWALLYYPSIGFVADVVLHLWPLALALVLIGDRAPWAAMALASLPEAILQLQVGRAQGSPGGLNALVAVHVFVFGLAQLWLLRRHGYLAMYGLRLSYYLVWHIAWGQLRLQLLF